MPKRPPSPAGTLDRFDLAILAILQKDNTTPQRAIGEAVALSAPAVQRRIKRMEESGVIRANVALVDPAAVGQPLTIFVEVQLESERARADRRGEARVLGRAGSSAMLLRHRRGGLHPRDRRRDA